MYSSLYLQNSDSDPIDLDSELCDVEVTAPYYFYMSTKFGGLAQFCVFGRQFFSDKKNIFRQPKIEGKGAVVPPSVQTPLAAPIRPMCQCIALSYVMSCFC